MARITRTTPRDALRPAPKDLVDQMEPDEAEEIGLENEPKTDKFKRVANFRLKKAVERMRMLRGTSNLATYEYDLETANKLCDMLAAEVEQIRSRFKNALADRQDSDEVPSL